MSQVTLYQFQRAWDVPSPSPFCMKVEGFLRLAGVDHKIAIQNDPRKAPKGKLPYISHRGKKIGDSNLIIEYLSKELGTDLDSELSAEEKAIHHAMRVMLDERLYFAMLYSRWADDDNWDLLKDSLFSAIPRLVRGVITNKIRGGVVSDLHSQGMSRHSADEIYKMGIEDLRCLSEYLGDKEWFGGGSPCILDICAVSYLVNFIRPPIQCPINDYVKQNSRLTGYTDRAMARIFEE
ncbi:MAG: glutathione S-transferase family protein [Pseudomonadales bacterium]|nr:glutathione S-transferase family protein [Pseudomonadales bacterium]